MTIGQSAPLLSLPDAAFPPGGEAVWYPGIDGRPMRAAFFAAAAPIGSVVLSPGRTEPIEKYVEVVGELVGRGYCVLVHDWRGQGHSSRLLDDRLRGHAAGFRAFVADFHNLLDLFEARLPKPRIAMGHSMGGCLTLTALAQGEAKRFAAAILSAPMLGVHLGGRAAWQVKLIAGLMRGLGRGGDYAVGGVTDPFTATFEKDRLTHDRARYQRARDQILADRDLALGNITWGWLGSALAAIDWLHRAPQVARLDIPVTVVAAGEDALVNNRDLAAVTARLPHGRYVEIPGAFHEILMETDDIRARFWTEFEALTAGLKA